MRSFSLPAVVTVVLTFFTTALLPVQAQELGGTVAAPGVFSYQAPKGWTVQDTPLSKYKVACDAPKNAFAANINVVTEEYAGSLEQYVVLNKQGIKAAPAFTNVEILSEKPFVTTAGVKGIAIVMKDTVQGMNLQQSFYFFDGAKSKYVVTASCLQADGATYAPIFDASLMTFSPQ